MELKNEQIIVMALYNFYRTTEKPQFLPRADPNRAQYEHKRAARKSSQKDAAKKIGLRAGQQGYMRRENRTRRIKQKRKFVKQGRQNK